MVVKTKHRYVPAAGGVQDAILQMLSLPLRVGVLVYGPDVMDATAEGFDFKTFMAVIKPMIDGGRIEYVEHRNAWYLRCRDHEEASDIALSILGRSPAGGAP